MVRGKVQLKRIESANSRHATFSKRRNGLLKKAKELSILCDAEIAVIIFSQSGRLYDFASSDIRAILERYHRHAPPLDHQQTNQIDMAQYIKELKHAADELAGQIEVLQLEQRKFLGQCLGSCSLEDLQDMDSQLDQSLCRIRTRKDQLFKEQIEQLKAQEVSLIENNVRLRKESSERPWQQPESGEAVYCDSNRRSLDVVVTELSIGLPEMAATAP